MNSGIEGGIWGQQRVGHVEMNEGKAACAERGASSSAREQGTLNRAGQRRGEELRLGSWAFPTSFLKPVPRRMLLPAIGIYETSLCLSTNSAFIINFNFKLDRVGFCSLQPRM